MLGPHLNLQGKHGFKVTTAPPHAQTRAKPYPDQTNKPTLSVIFQSISQLVFLPILLWAVKYTAGRSTFLLKFLDMEGVQISK